MRNKRTLFFFILFNFFFFYYPLSARTTPTAMNGVIDLRNWNFQKNGSVILDGKWAFYWEKFLSEIKESDLPNYINTGSWNKKKLDNQNYKNTGFGTYALKLRLPQENSKLAILLPRMLTAARITFGQFSYNIGQIAKNKEDLVPVVKYDIIEIKDSIKNIQPKELTLYIEVANFFDARSGMLSPPIIGLTNDLIEESIQELIIESIILGLFLLFGIHHLILHITRKNRAAFWFGIFSLIMALRTMFVGSEIIHSWLPDLDFRFDVRIQYLTFYLAVPVFSFLLRHLFPKEYPKKIHHILIILSFIFLATLILPTLVFTKLLIGFQIIAAIAILIWIYISIKAVMNKRSEANLFIFGLIFLAISSGIDIIIAIKFSLLSNITSFGLVQFFFIQSIVIARRNAHTYKMVVDLSKDLRKSIVASQKFVPFEFLKILDKNDITQIRLGDKIEKKMTVLFSDIRKFTELSESMSVEENFNFINNYLQEMGPLIRQNSGFIDKYIGDAIMALFPNKAENAIDSAIDLLNSLVFYNQKNNLNINVGIGIHIGRLMLGTIGEAQRMEGTVISDAVNLASRLEGLTKIYGCSIIISDHTLNQLNDPEIYKYRMLDTIKVKGKKEFVTIYQIFSDSELKNYKNFEKIKALFEKALNHYRMGEFNLANEIFQGILSINPNDTPTRVLLQKSKLFAEKNIGDDWDAITTMLEK